MLHIFDTIRYLHVWHMHILYLNSMQCLLASVAIELHSKICVCVSMSTKYVNGLDEKLCVQKEHDKGMKMKKKDIWNKELLI